jgi:hypothetical protein
LAAETQELANYTLWLAAFTAMSVGVPIVQAGLLRSDLKLAEKQRDSAVRR